MKNLPLSGILSPCQEKEATKKYGFTLVELIVVITILAILGTIAFISLQGYSQDARDSVRISDISKIKTSLELFQLDAGKYPETTDATNITYSGAIAWTQGIFGEATFNNITKLDKIPLDPVTDRKYVYSVTNTKQEYQVAGIMEGDEVTMNINQPHPSPLLRGEGIKGILETNAAGKTAMLKISGNYNGKVLKVSTGGTDYVLAVPSIITSSGFTLDQIVANNYLAYNGYKNLPAQYAGSSYEILGDDEINLVNSADLVIYSGDLKTLSSSELAGTTARKNLIEKLKSAYSGTAITGIGEIAQIVNTDIEDENATEFLGATIVSNNLGGSITASTPRVNVCATQPEYTGATYEIGLATEPDQVWQSSNASEPCYWTCGGGRVLDENTCVSETCAGTTPDGTAKVSNATSFAGGTWGYSSTPGKCTYSCGTLYHTEDGGTSCISDIKNCTIPHGIGEQTWNGTLRGTCIITSCTDGYTGTNCEIAPPIQFLSNCTANGQIYYADSSGNKLATVTNEGVATWESGKSILNLTCAGYIIICSGNNVGYILQACNAGADTLYVNQTFVSSTTIRNSTVNKWAGGLYQWGNNADVSRSSLNTTRQTCTENSTYNLGIYVIGSIDWCYTPTDNIWGNTTNTNTARQGPCLTGYHVPSQPEWSGIVSAGGWGTTLGTSMKTTLKLPLSGRRYRYDGNINYQNGGGYYWSSSPNGTNGDNLVFYSNSISPSQSNSRADSYSVRCLKN